MKNLMKFKENLKNCFFFKGTKYKFKYTRNKIIGHKSKTVSLSVPAIQLYQVEIWFHLPPIL